MINENITAKCQNIVASSHLTFNNCYELGVVTISDVAKLILNQAFCSGEIPAQSQQWQHKNKVNWQQFPVLIAYFEQLFVRGDRT